MRIRFWGTRGSLAKPGPTTVRYGGNTSCVEVHLADGMRIILDCGTGAHDLGQALLTSGEHPLHGHLLITHTHWDHIQGFPFFAPLFTPGNEWDIYAPGSLGRGLEDTLAGQMEYTYFPITLDQLGATIRYHDLVEGTFQLGAARITARYLNHPALTLGYRVEVGGVTIVYATDHEPHARHQPAVSSLAGSPPGALPVHPEDRGHIEFLSGADLVIHDAQFTDEEYPKKIGWGHGTVEYAVSVALAAGAKRLALFHHDPLRDDEALERLVATCRHRIEAWGGALDVFAAAEGQTLELPEQEMPPPDSVRHTPASALPKATATEGSPKTVLIVNDEPDLVDFIRVALSPEGYRLLSAYDGEAALRIARADHPSLILLDWQLPGRNGLEVCQTLRAESDPLLRDVPIVLITGQTGAEDTAAAFAAGVTDYLTKPFKATYVRSRVRGWLLRTHTDTPDQG